MSARLPNVDSGNSPGPATPDLAVIVINYDSGEHLRNCVGELGKAHALNAEIVVVDNASSDGSLEGIEGSLENLRVIRNQVNSGYGRACNRGVASTTAPMVCLLNPDVLPDPAALAALLSAAAGRPDVGILGPRLLNSDGSLYPSCRVVPSLKVAIGHGLLGFFYRNNRFSREYQLLDWDHSTEREVDWVSGAAMMVRREAFEQIGGFDEGYFMYMEDVDLCDRIRQAGFRAVYYPQAVMVHHVAGSSRRTPYRMIRHHHMSLLRYAWNKSKGTPRMAIFPLIVAGVLVRMGLAWLDNAIRRGVPAPRRQD